MLYYIMLSFIWRNTDRNFSSPVNIWSCLKYRARYLQMLFLVLTVLWLAALWQKLFLTMWILLFLNFFGKISRKLILDIVYTSIAGISISKANMTGTFATFLFLHGIQVLTTIVVPTSDVSTHTSTLAVTWYDMIWYDMWWYDMIWYDLQQLQFLRWIYI